MVKKTHRSSIFGGNTVAPKPPEPWTGPCALRNKGPRSGQAYTEYLVILLFGVFLALGVVIVDRTIPPEEVGIIDRLYGYIFDYYAGLVNFLNLPIF